MSGLICLFKGHDFMESKKIIDTEKYIVYLRTCRRCGIGELSPDDEKWITTTDQLDNPLIKACFEKSSFNGGKRT